MAADLARPVLLPNGMIRTASVVAALTMCVLVPAGLHRLGAGPTEVAALARPGASEIAIGDATVAVSVDRSIVHAGDKVAIELRATAESAQKVRVAVIVHEARGSDGGRVSLPPVETTYKTLTLEATPEGGPARHLDVKLRGYVGTEMDGMTAFGTYSVLVMEPAVAKTLRKARRAFKRGYDVADDPTSVDAEDYWEVMGGSYAGNDGEHTIARVEVNTYKPSKKVRIELPDGAQQGSSFVANVVISNPTRKPLEALSLYVSQPYLNADQSFPIEAATFLNPADPEPTTVPARGEVVVPIEVEVNAYGTLGVFATVIDGDGYTYATALDGIAVAPMDPADFEPVADNPWVDDADDTAAQVHIAEVH